MLDRKQEANIRFLCQEHHRLSQEYSRARHREALSVAGAEMGGWGMAMTSAVALLYPIGLFWIGLAVCAALMVMGHFGMTRWKRRAEVCKDRVRGLDERGCRLGFIFETPFDAGEPSRSWVRLLPSGQRLDAQNKESYEGAQ